MARRVSVKLILFPDKKLVIQSENLTPDLITEIRTVMQEWLDGTKPVLILPADWEMEVAHAKEQVRCCNCN